MLKLEQLTGKSGYRYPGFLVRRGDSKCVAVAVITGDAEDWAVISHKRYARDASLVASVSKITGLVPRHDFHESHRLSRPTA